MLDIPVPLLESICFTLGAKPAGRLATVSKALATILSKDAFWHQLSMHTWPAETLAPSIPGLQVRSFYPTWRARVADTNRRGAWRAWRPTDSIWRWKHNCNRRFYCGRATLLALDEIESDLCIFFHAVTNMPDLRPAAGSSIYAVEARPNGGFHVKSRLPRPQCAVLRRSGSEQKGILKWKITDFSPGNLYAFAFATESESGNSDYPLLPFLDLREAGIPAQTSQSSLGSGESSPASAPEQPSTGAAALAVASQFFQSVANAGTSAAQTLVSSGATAASTGMAWAAGRGSVVGGSRALAALRWIADRAGPPMYVAPTHVEQPELDSQPLRMVAETLLQGDRTGRPNAEVPPEDFWPVQR